MIDLDALIINLKNEIIATESEILKIRNDKKLHFLMGKADAYREVLKGVQSA